jgi:hypothetical protein
MRSTVLQQVAFVDHRQRDTALDQPRHLVVSVQVGRIGHPDQQYRATVFQHDGAIPARLAFGQQPYDIRIDIEEFEIDVRDVELLGERAGNLLLGNEAVFHENAAEFAPGAFLLAQRELKLFFRQQLLLHQNLAKADLFRPCHKRPLFYLLERYVADVPATLETCAAAGLTLENFYHVAKRGLPSRRI